ncbi:structural maintenance of chromosomes family protein [Babesia bovis T2Bo]|uniref:Structural maintenance of chromosomes protein 5 n=1 Tax=Babesia bovis TaxID=5865 RepID=A7ASY1_BABBO|nr:structural maintenance of chromosomes family protein [Babesia bovis T2Bo]EDO06042.1 structural maintenance of chromosomes family protein [Babesia bovis T2Bo]|eukprot:XP_001609610.1 hypothetical protein [Babesia bovis T2Bo]
MGSDGSARFREGAIDSITVENWMAYTGPVRLKALPGVNIIAAANGCGKSAIVCAIALGLGFDTNVLSRGDNIRSFIKRGFNQSKIEIGLIDSSMPSGILTLTRLITVTHSNTSDGTSQADSTDLPGDGEEFANADPKSSNSRHTGGDEDEEYDESTPSKMKTRGNKRRKTDKALSMDIPSTPASSSTSVRNEWSINGKSVTFEMVKSVQRRLNLQVNNLLTFLAQANVGKFAALSPQQLFRSTLNAIEPSLCTDLDTMTDMAKDLRSQRSKMQLLVDELNSTTVKIAQLRVISDALSKIKDATLYANLVKQRLYRVKLSNLERGYRSTKTRMNSTSEDYRRLTDERSMLDQNIRKVTQENDRLLKLFRNRISKAKGVNVLHTVKPVKTSDMSVVPLADDNTFDKVFYKCMTAMRTFAANVRPKPGIIKSKNPNKDVLERRLSDVNKEIELLEMQVSAENELTSEIAECRMQEEAARSRLAALQSPSIRSYEDIQVENLLKRLNVIKRDGYRRFMRWRREQLNTTSPGSQPDANDSGDSPNTKPVRDAASLPKLLVSDMKVRGKSNCCIIEETASTYMESLLLTEDMDPSTYNIIKRYNLPSLTPPKEPPVLCRVTDRMKEFGVKLFLHELVECQDPATMNTLASVARLGTSFVVDEDIFSLRMRGESTVKLPLVTLVKAEPNEFEHVDTSEHHSGMGPTKSSEVLDMLLDDRTVDSHGSQLSGNSTARSGVSVTKCDTHKPLEQGSQSVDSGVGSTVAPDSANLDLFVERKGTAKDECGSPVESLTMEEDFFRSFYRCMTDEISEQLGQRVHILRYYIGNKRHIYREFRGCSELYSDYCVEIPTVPTILHDCSSLITADNSTSIDAAQVELQDITKRLSVLDGMLFVRRQDNTAVSGRLYVLNREKKSLCRTLNTLEGALGPGGNKQRGELDSMERSQRDEISESLEKRADCIMTWIEKARVRRAAVSEAQSLHSEYCKVHARKIRLEDLSKLTENSYEEISTEYKRLEGTLEEQEMKLKGYQREITELNILIKAISGELVESSADGENSADTREREALRIRQEKASKLDQLTEADLERELQLAELDVKRLERDDCEETINAKEMRDSIIHEERLSTEIAQAEAGILELNRSRTEMFLNWLSRVNEIVSQVDFNFGRYMSRIGEGAGGQIRLDATMDNIKDAKLTVMVKFHQDRDLLPLNASYQSGGERGVTTMVYILAVQHLTTNAFFVIDEINQGLDANYEKRIMGLLLGCYGDQNTESGSQRTRELAPPQYFVITPQLLPGIDLRNAALHFPLNGPGVINGMVL